MSKTSAFIETLRRLLSDPALATKNAVFDEDFQTYYINRVDGLTQDQVSWFSAAEVDLVTDVPTGALAANVNENSIDLNVDGFEFRTSKYRDGLQSTPRKIRRRSPSDLLVATPADRVRYVLADPTDGVLLLDQNLEIVRTFPGLISAGTLAANEYREAECAVSATVAAQELMIIACGKQHAVQILDYATGALVATIGTPGTPGLPDAGAELTDPVSVSVDEANGRLFIACRTGAGTGGDATDNGFVCEFDISAPAAPVLVGYILVANGLYRLNNAECLQPSDVFFQPETAAPQNMRLWVSNGFGDVAAFERALPADAFVPALVIEAQGDGYVLGPDNLPLTSNEFSENAIDVLTTTYSRLFVATSRTGPVEVFRASTGAAATPLGTHESTFGQRGIEETQPYNRTLRSHSNLAQPGLTFGVFSGSAGVVADATILPGETATSEVLVVADAAAGRVQRLRTEVYEDLNTVTFDTIVSTVPSCIVGWFLPGDATFDTDHLVLEVRDPGDATVTPVIPATTWRQVPKAGFASAVEGPTLTRYQIRLRCVLPRSAKVKAYRTSSIGVLLRQEW